MSSNIVILNPARTQGGRSQSQTRAFEYEETLVAIGNGKTILMPDDVSSVVVTATFSAGASGYIEATSDVVQKVKNEDPNLQWIIWDSGTVDITTQDYCIPPTALRMVQVGAGEMTMTMRAQ